MVFHNDQFSDLIVSYTYLWEFLTDLFADYTSVVITNSNTVDF
jgi:hypothetical protein